MKIKAKIYRHSSKSDGVKVSVRVHSGVHKTRDALSAAHRRVLSLLASNPRACPKVFSPRTASRSMTSSLWSSRLSDRDERLRAGDKVVEVGVLSITDAGKLGASVALV
jgi:hypothetical protein